MTSSWRIMPILLFVGILIGLAWRLIEPSSPAVPSQLISRPVPSFDLAPALPGKAGLKSADLAAGQPRLLNIFASWCIPCGDEAPVLEQLRARGVKIDAIAVRDTPDGIRDFLSRHGDPYDRLGADPQSRAQISLGSSGVPETFVIDGRGVMRHQYIGALKSENIPDILKQLAEAR